MIILNQEKYNKINQEEKPKMCFVSVPKNATTGMGLTFKKIYGRPYIEDRNKDFVPYDDRIAFAGHNHVVGCIGDNGLDFFNDALIVGTLRNPWHRIVSYVMFKRRHNTPNFQWLNDSKYRKDKVQLLKDYLMFMQTYKPIDNTILYNQLTYFSYDGDISVFNDPQIREKYFIKDKKLLNEQFGGWKYFRDNNIEIKNHRKLHVDVFLKFETINNDFVELCEIMKIPHIPYQKTSITASQKGDINQYYDEENISLVREMCADEIKLGGYTEP